MARRSRRAAGAVRQLPSGKWQAELWNEGTGRYTSLGTFASKLDADATLRVAQTDKSRGDWIDPKKGRVTFASYSAEWLEDRTDLAPRTGELYCGILKNHLGPAFGTTELSAIDPVMVRRWFSKISKKGPGKATAAKSYRLLRTIMGRAVTEGLVTRTRSTSIAPARKMPPSGRF